MNYRELQKALKQYRLQGCKVPALNSKKEVLQDAYNQLQTATIASFTVEEQPAKPKGKKVQVIAVNKSQIKATKTNISSQLFKPRKLQRETRKSFTTVGFDNQYKYIDVEGTIMYCERNAKLDVNTGLPRFARVLASLDSLTNQIITLPTVITERRYSHVVLDYVYRVA